MAPPVCSICTPKFAHGIKCVPTLQSAQKTWIVKCPDLLAKFFDGSFKESKHICFRHFDDQCFDDDGQLKRSAIPTIYRVNWDCKLDPARNRKPGQNCICYSRSKTEAMIQCQSCPVVCHQTCLQMTDEEVKTMVDKNWCCPFCSKLEGVANNAEDDQSGCDTPVGHVESEAGIDSDDDMPKLSPQRFKFDREASDEEDNNDVDVGAESDGYTPSDSDSDDENYTRKKKKNIVHPVEARTCETCHRVFSERGSMLNHVKSVHLKERKKQCQQCGLLFFSLQHLKRHFDTVHLGVKKKKLVKKSVCDICNKVLKCDRQNMEKHILCCHGLYKLVCDVCDRSFSQNTNLVTHLCLHTGTKPYVCSYCYMRFTHNVVRKDHMKKCSMLMK